MICLEGRTNLEDEGFRQENVSCFLRFLSCYAKYYTVLCNPPMNHPETFVCRLLRLQRELRTQSRLHLSGVFQTLSWDCNRRCAHRASLGYWGYNRPASVVYERWRREARDRGSRHATDTNTIRENSRHDVADFDPGTGGTRTKRVSWVRQGRGWSHFIL